METGFYRCTHSEISTRDWIKLNFNQVQAELIRTLAERDVCVLEDLERIDLGPEPEEPETVVCVDDGDKPERDEYDSQAEFAEATEQWQEDVAEYQEYLLAYAKWEEDYEEWEGAQQLYSWPVAWNTMWAAQNHGPLIQALADSGFVVYRTSGALEDLGPIVFGVDGGGYGFFGAHWIPLRARLARRIYDDDGHDRGEMFARLLETLADQMRREGEDPKRFLVEYGHGVPEMGQLECVVGWELHEALGLEAGPQK